jgi:hypothetical protein
MDIPKLTTLDQKKFEDLKSRIDSFLPKIDAANKVLLNQMTVKEGSVIPLDISLIQDDDKDNDDDDDNDDTDDHCDGDNQTNVLSQKEPTIELKFQISDMNQNEEIFNLLSSNDAIDKNDDIDGTEQGSENIPIDQPLKKPKVLIEEIN